MRFRALISAVLLALVALPAVAQSTRARLDDLDLRVGQLEETLRGQALIELSQRLAALEAEARTLRGDIEVLQQENETLRKQQRDLAADHDRRIAALESRLTAMAQAATTATTNAGAVGGDASGALADTTSPAAVTSPTAATSPAAGAAPTSPAVVATGESPEVLYGRAFDALKAARYAEAISGMGEFIARHPGHPLADNAQYWLAQAHYVNRDYARAVEAFALVGVRSPDSSKAPDALLKKGLCEIELGRNEAARATLNDVVRRYPQNEAARLAREQLAKLR